MDSLFGSCVGMTCDSCGKKLTVQNNSNGYKLCDRCFKFHGFDKPKKRKLKK